MALAATILAGLLIAAVIALSPRLFMPNTARHSKPGRVQAWLDEKP